MIRESGMMLKPPIERSAWPAGPLTSTEPGRVAIDAALRVVSIPERFLILSGERRGTPPEDVDVIEWAGVRFVREDRL